MYLKYGCSNEIGNNIGNGNQYISWIHESDFVRLVDWIVCHTIIDGIVHACSPYPIKNHDFMKVLRQALQMPFGLPNYSWVTRLGGKVIGAEADLVLSGRRIVSAKSTKWGFVFDYPEISAAIRNLVIK